MSEERTRTDQGRRARVVVALVLLFVLVMGILGALVRPDDDGADAEQPAASDRTTTTTGAEGDQRPEADGDDDESEPDRDERRRDEDEEAEAEEGARPLPGAPVGETQRVGRRRVSVETVEREGDHLVVAVRLVNVGRRPVPYGPQDFALQLADGSSVTAVGAGDGSLAPGELAPAQEVTGEVRFVAPSGDHVVIFDPGTPRQARWRVSG